jgi:hypothetical protein
MRAGRHQRVGDGNGAGGMTAGRRALCSGLFDSWLPRLRLLWRLLLLLLL